MARTAIIIGAGIGGLAAAVSLRRAGWTVRVYERAANPGELGFALLLAPNAMAALRELGLDDALLRAGVATSKVELRQLDGRVLRRFERPADGRVVVALRSALHGALLAAVGESAITCGSSAVSFVTSDGAAEVKFANGSSDVADLLIGADGVGSIVRSQLHPGEAAPEPSGFLAVRGVARGVSAALNGVSAVGYFGDGIEAATALAGDDAVYWYLSLLSGDVPFNRREPREVANAQTTSADAALRSIIAGTADGDIRFDELFVRAALARWGTGPVTLVGDAAHPVLPHTGQGAAQALEDAVALGVALGSARAGPIEPALRAYESVRAARTKKFIALGPRIARVTTTHSRSTKWLRSTAVRWLPTRVLANATVGDTTDPHRELRTSPRGALP